MARSYANIITAIWRDPDFRALTADAQRVYLLLATQPNISAVGMLPVTLGRWAAMAADTTPDDIRASLSRLVAARFVAVDDVTEELLVRSFVKHDNGYRNSKRVPVIRDAAGEIESQALRQVLAVELVKLGLPPEWTGELPVEPDGPPDSPPDDPSDRASDSPSDRASDRPSAESPQRPTPAPVHNSVDNTFPQVDSLSDGLSDRASDGISGSERVVVTTGTYIEPQPTTRKPQPPTSALAPLGAADATEVLDAEIVTDGPALFVVPDPPTPGTDLAVAEPANAGQINRQWIDYCKAHEVRLTTAHIKRYGAAIKRALGEQFPPDLIKRALGQMFADRVTSRPALFDNYLIRAQQGPELPPRRASRTESSMATPGGSTAALIRDALTRPA